MNPIPIPIAYGPVTDRETTHFIGDVTIPPLPVVRVPHPIPPRSSGPYGLNRIADHVAQHFGISLSLLMSSTRKAHVAWARQVAMFIAYTTTPVCLKSVAEHFNRVCHTTVHHACNTVRNRMETEPKTCAEVKAIVAQLNK